MGDMERRGFVRLSAPEFAFHTFENGEAWGNLRWLAEAGAPVTDALGTQNTAPLRDETGRVGPTLPEPVWRRLWRRITGG